MTSQARVFCLVYHAHAATSELSHNVIVGDCFADHSGSLSAVGANVRPGAKLRSTLSPGLSGPHLVGVSQLAWMQPLGYAFIASSTLKCSRRHLQLVRRL